MTQFLIQYPYPDRKLRFLLDGQSHDVRRLSPEQKLDVLYAQILAQCPWDDMDFVEDYQLVPGTILTARTPLTALAIQYLHRERHNLDVPTFLQNIASVLSSSGDLGLRIQVFHVSFADFVTSRASADITTRHFAVNGTEHNQKMAHLCLRLMIQDLASLTSGIGFLERYPGGNIGAVIAIPCIQVSEAVAYACRFWADHTLHLEDTISDEFTADLQTFMSLHFSTWLETTVSIDRYQTISRVISMLAVCELATYIYAY